MDRFRRAFFPEIDDETDAWLNGGAGAIPPLDPTSSAVFPSLPPLDLGLGIAPDLTMPGIGASFDEPISMLPYLLPGRPRTPRASADDWSGYTDMGQGDIAYGGTPVERAIDAATQDPRIRQSMRLAALLEGGNFTGGWGVGDQDLEGSYGPYQINYAVHKDRISKEASADPAQATNYMLPEFQAAVARVERERPGMWQSDPKQAARLAAYYAERPAVIYDQARVDRAWGQIQARQPAATQTATQFFGPRTGSILGAATSALGTPYVWGGARPGGFDCSGLAQWAYAQAGVRLPRTAQQQYDATQRLGLDQLQPGDLVFYSGTYDSGTYISHVAIYLGNGQVIMAPSEGSAVKRVALRDPYWGRHLVGGGRA